jgi:hypothetical protein
MSTQSPITPIRASHRFIQKCVKIICGDKVLEIPSEFDMINRIFLRMGGSWEKIYKGDPNSIVLLKKIIKVLYKANKLSKKEEWK